ncbi:MAG: hypothetical protein AB7D27_17600 [Desulfomicrobium sp.]
MLRSSPCNDSANDAWLGQTADATRPDHPDPGGMGDCHGRIKELVLRHCCA